MGKTISNIEVIIEGIIINESFSMDKYVHQEYISNVNCTIYGERKVKISGKIESEDKGLTQEKNKRLRKLVDNKLKQSVSL